MPTANRNEHVKAVLGLISVKCRPFTFLIRKQIVLFVILDDTIAQDATTRAELNTTALAANVYVQRCVCFISVKKVCAIQTNRKNRCEHRNVAQ